jgi:hypothetical protein
LDFVEQVIDTAVENTISFVVYFALEVAFVALFRGWSVLITGAFALLTLTDLITNFRTMEGARKFRNFFLALIALILNLWLISLFGL